MDTPATPLTGILSALKAFSEAESTIAPMLLSEGFTGLRTPNARYIENHIIEQATDISIRQIWLARFTSGVHKVDAIWHGDTALHPEMSDPVIAVAYRIAVHAHVDVRRKNGEPYINHPLRVADQLRGYTPVIQAIALLHDTVEDSELTLYDLRALGVPESVVSGVNAMTKRDGEKYEGAVLRAASHPAANIVKLADVLDNSSKPQLACFTLEKRARQTAKYGMAKRILLPFIQKNGTTLRPLFGG